MAKPDGRIEKGQKLGSAISARRWNDLCDAADIAHGRRPGVTAGQATNYPARVIVPMAKSYSWFAFPGMAVLYTGLNIGVGSGDWNQFGSTNTWPITAQSWSTTIQSITDKERTHWARQSDRVGLWGYCEPLGPDNSEANAGDLEYGNIQNMIGIVTEPSSSDSPTVNVCISGPAVAMVRVLSGSQTSEYVVRSAIKSRVIPGLGSLNTPSDLQGILDIVRGGSIRVAEVSAAVFYGQANVYPQIRLAEVFL